MTERKEPPRESLAFLGFVSATILFLTQGLLSETDWTVRLGAVWILLVAGYLVVTYSDWVVRSFLERRRLWWVLIVVVGVAMGARVTWVYWADSHERAAILDGARRFTDALVGNSNPHGQYLRVAGDAPPIDLSASPDLFLQTASRWDISYFGSTERERASFFAASIERWPLTQHDISSFQAAPSVPYQVTPYAADKLAIVRVSCSLPKQGPLSMLLILRRDDHGWEPEISSPESLALVRAVYTDMVGNEVEEIVRRFATAVLDPRLRDGWGMLCRHSQDAWRGSAGQLPPWLSLVQALPSGIRYLPVESKLALATGPGQRRGDWWLYHTSPSSAMVETLYYGQVFALHMEGDGWKVHVIPQVSSR